MIEKPKTQAEINEEIVTTYNSYPNQPSIAYVSGNDVLYKP